MAKAMQTKLSSMFLWRLLRKPAVLDLSIRGSLPESFAPTASWLTGPQPPRFLETVNALRKAANDPLVTAIHVRLGPLSCGLAKANELAGHIRHAVDRGKEVVAYAPRLTEQELLVGASCTRVVVPPCADVALKGFAGSAVFVRAAFDKLGIEPEVFRAGAFKGMADTFAESTMPPTVAQQLQRLLHETLERYHGAVLARRGKTIEEAQALFQNRWTPESLQSAGWIDSVEYGNEMEKKAGAHNVVSGEYYRGVSLAAAGVNRRWGSASSVAIIPIAGNIVSGKGQPQRSVGDLDIVPLLRKARDRASVKSVVLRVSSPGGSALASSLIAHEVAALRKVKPVVVSMGPVAASGGYYVSAPATHIMCDAFTLTGSIGVFGLKFNAAKLLDRLGVSVGTVTDPRAPTALMDSIHKPLSAVEHQHMSHNIERVYARFVTDVASGRNMTVERVRELAQGKVYVGHEAVLAGLCDSTGGLFDAVKLAWTLGGGSPDSQFSPRCQVLAPSRGVGSWLLSSRSLGALLPSLLSSMPDLRMAVQLLAGPAASLSESEWELSETVESLMALAATGEPLAWGAIKPL